MLHSSFGHRLLMVFGILFAGIAAVVAAKLGWLGDAAHDFIDRVWMPLQDFYRARSQVLTPAFKLIGFSGTMLAAVWTVHKGWHYAEMRLPARLAELNLRWMKFEVRRRAEVIPELKDIVTISPPSIQPAFVQKVWVWLFNGEQRRLLRCSQRLDKHEAELGVLTANRDRCRTEIATGYLEIGSLLARCAPDNRQGVLNVFKKSLEFDSKDLDALELSAKQAFAVGYEQPAFRYLSELSVAASESNEQIRHFRAQRFQAEILHNRDTQTSWADARAKLAGVIASLNNADGLDPVARNCELALSRELLADVQITREKFTAARAELEVARELFQKVPAPDGPRGLQRLEELSKRLRAAEKDKDNPDVPD